MEADDGDVARLRAGLDTYRRRALGGGWGARVGSLLIIGACVAALGVWPVIAAVGWAAGFGVLEVLLRRWWAAAARRTETARAPGLKRLYAELTAISAGLAAYATLPCLFTAMHGPDAAMIGVVASAGVLLIITAQHTLHRDMFLATGPAPLGALGLNLLALGPGYLQVLHLALGICIALNARLLQRSNAEGFAELVRLKLEADSANRAKTAFLSNMSHELRTPLNGVIGMAEVLAFDTLTPLQRSRVTVIRECGSDLLKLLNALLDAARTETGRIEVRLRAFPVGPEIAAVCADASGQAALKGLSLQTAGLDAGLTARGDPERVRQIVRELVENAVRLTERGYVRVTAAAVGGAPAITVEDSGPGIAPAALDRLFLPFAQGDDASASERRGAGLGLAVARTLARRMGGELTARSHLGRGSAFTLVLAPAEAGQDARSGPNRPALRVLIAEPTEAGRSALRSLLGGAAAACGLAATGPQAVEIFEHGDWDLVLLGLPGGAGDTAVKLRRIEEVRGCGRTPIWTVDASARPLAPGGAIDGRLSAPVAPSDVLRALEAAAQARRTRPGLSC